MAYNFDYRDPPQFYEEVILLSMSGLTIKEIGDYYSRDPDDWIEWCEEHPLVELKVAVGKARGIALAGQKLLQEIKAGKINAIMFYLKTQGQFTEKSSLQIDQTLKHAHIPLPPVPVDPVEASKIYQQFMKGS